MAGAPSAAPLLADPTRPVAAVAERFARCALGEDDVDVEFFESACRHFADDVLERINTLGARLTAKETHANQNKVKNARSWAYGAAPAVAEPDAASEQGRRSMRSLLKHEMSQNIHKPAGKIADPSGAMGLLWSMRGLQVYRHWFRAVANGELGPDEATGALMRESIDQSHGELLGFISRRTVALACKTMSATWPQIANKFAPTLSQANLDVTQWCDAVDPLLGRIHAMLEEYDMIDKRRLP